MSQKIDLDHGRFRQIIRGKIKQNLRKYISQGEMIAKKGKDTVAIPIPSVDIPHFKHGDKQQGGVGQGEGEVGDALGVISRALGLLEMVQRTKRQGGRLAFINERGDVADVVV